MRWRNSKWSALLVGVLVALTAEAGVYKRLRRNDGASNRGIVYSATFAGSCGTVSGLTVTRSSGYCTDSSGNMTLIASNTGRDDRDGLLQEAASTNVLLRSEEIDNASWTKTNGAVSSTNVSGPTGNLAEVFTAAAGSARHNIAQAYTATAADWTCSAIVKGGGGVDYAWFSINNGTNYTHFNLTTGVKGTEGTGNTGRIRALSGGYYRISVTRTMGAGATQVHLGLAGADAAATYAAVGTENIAITGMQCEALNVASSYIPTSGTSATRTVERNHYLLPASASFAAGGSITGTVLNSRLASSSNTATMNPAAATASTSNYFLPQFGTGSGAQFGCYSADGTAGVTAIAPGTATGTTDTFKCVLTPTTMTACLNGACSAAVAHGKNTAAMTATSFDFGWLRPFPADSQPNGGLSAACLATTSTGCQ